MSARSAFALRRQLSSQPSSTVASVQAPEATVQSSSTSSELTSNRGPKGRRSARLKGTTKSGDSEAISQKPLGVGKSEDQIDQANASLDSPIPQSTLEHDTTQRPHTTESNSVPPQAAVTQQFSTFKPTKQNAQKLPGGILKLRLTESEVGMPGSPALHPSKRLMFPQRFLALGSYGVRVAKGEVTIAGASIKSSDFITWVHAPHCHAVPVLRCSDETILELHPHPHAADLRSLERLSPLFRGLWNDQVEDSTKTKRKKSIETFQMVCQSKQPGFFVSFCPSLSAESLIYWADLHLQRCSKEGHSPGSGLSPCLE